MRIAIVTDAWFPQVNGVVRTLSAVAGELVKFGHEVKVVSPEGRRSMPMPFYPEIPLAFVTSRSLGRELIAIAPDAIYVATEGPLGWARNWCARRKIPFSSGFHTRFTDYLELRLPLPGLARLSWVDPAQIPWAEPKCPGADPQHRPGSRKAWLRQYQNLDARRRPLALPPL